MAIKVTEVDYIIHSILHSDITIEDGIDKCTDGEKVSELLRKLTAYGELDEDKYNNIMRSMAERGKLDRFMKKGDENGK